MKELYLQEKLIGKLRDDNTLVIFRDAKKHFFFKFQGFGMNIKALDYLENLNVEYIYIDYKNGDIQKVYETKVSEWIAHGVYFKNTIPPFDEQKILHKKFWVQIK